jgi:uracil-DNA glycosylase family 4
MDDLIADVAAHARFLESLTTMGISKPQRAVAAASSSAAAFAKLPPVGETSDAADLAGVREWVGDCQRCKLAGTRKSIVFGQGNPHADLMFVGEAPGADEDVQGLAFVGRAGQLLTDIIEKGMKMRREDVFIANVLKCRPPGNRDPKPEEVARCLPYLSNQIALLKPKIILAVGRIAAQNLLATDVPLGRLRGKVHAFGAANTPLVATYHPAYLLRTPSDKRKAWDDLKFARATHSRVTGQAGS